MNGVQVFASVGNSGDEWVKREEEVRQEAEVFKVVASTAHGRQEVSIIKQDVVFLFSCAHHVMFLRFLYACRNNPAHLSSNSIYTYSHSSSLNNARG